MKFGTVVVDPPWPYPEGFPAWGARGSVRRQAPYRAMPTEAIASLRISELLEREAYAFLWTTNRHLPEAFSVLSAWGLTYRQTIVWEKPPTKGLGGMVGINVEFLLVAQKIGRNTNSHGKRTTGRRERTSVFRWPKRGHSEKPWESFAMVEGLSLGPYLEVFARKRRLGWASIGDEIDGLDVRDAIEGLRIA